MSALRLGRALRRAVGAVAVTATLLTSLAVDGPARADTAPPAGTPTTVTADGLPTWQLNGVVWSQVLVGDTVYATGSFTKARPPGKPVGDPSEVPALNIFAYSLSTGARVTTFNHRLNAQGMAIAATPDGTKLIVGGDFTSVDGVPRSHLAVFTLPTGALSPVTPSTNGQVRAITATNATVYAGGNFTTSGTQTRSRLARFTLSTGALQPWAPTADAAVWSMVLSPDGSRLVVGGAFTTLTTVAAYGMGAIDVTTGVTRPWAANQVIRAGGVNGAVTSLHTDGRQIYGGSYSFGTGAKFEGTFALDPTTGAIKWLNDCHGDTYDTLPIGSVLYSVGHAHDCSAIGTFPETTPRTWHRAIASTTYPVGTNTGPDAYGWNFAGRPAAQQLTWYPTLTVGLTTGMKQAAWSLAGNTRYIALGGEFVAVNGTPQQGLVRFAIKGVAPAKRGPVVVSSAVTATATAAPRTVRVTWSSMWDMDNATLRYDVFRDGRSVVYSATVASSFWRLPSLGFVDRGLDPGSSHTYAVRVTDPDGNVQWSATSPPVTVPVDPTSPYGVDVLTDGATSLWRLGEPSGTVVKDSLGLVDATAGASATIVRGQPGAIDGDPDTATRFGGVPSDTVGTNAAVVRGQTYSVEAWFRTTSTAGGKIVGLGSSRSGASASSDTNVYLDDAGHVLLGLQASGPTVLSSSGRYADGAWHHVVATGSATGTTLYVDGSVVASSTAVSGRTTGFWRIGGDSLVGWPGRPTSDYLAGTVDDVALYPGPLSLRQVRQHYIDSGRTPAVVAPVARVTSTTEGLQVSADGSASTTLDGTITGYAWSFGDGSGGTGAQAAHDYAAPGTYPVTLTVTNSLGWTGSVTTDVTVSGDPSAPPTTSAP